MGIYRTLLHSGFSTIAGILYTGVAFLTLHMHFSVRPLLFTYLFLALTVEVWFRRTQPLTRDWFFLPIIFAAWANLHAGWAAAFVFLVISMGGRLLDRVSGRGTGEDAPLIPWMGLTLLCLLATWLNPWGWALHRQVFEFATQYKSFALWDEYARPNFLSPNMSAVTIQFIIGVVILARLSRRAPLWRWETVLPVLFFFYEGLQTQRHVLLLVIVASVAVTGDLQAVLQTTWMPWLRERLRQFQERQRRAMGDAWLAGLAAIGLTLLFLHAPAAQKIEVGKSLTPGLVSFIRDHPDRFQRPLVTTWNAGPLLWNLRPDFRVSFDDRGDFYGDKTVFPFVNLYNGVPGWRRDCSRRGATIPPFSIPICSSINCSISYPAGTRSIATTTRWSIGKTRSRRSSNRLTGFGLSLREGRSRFPISR